MQPSGKYIPFRQRYNIYDRKSKFQKHIQENPEKIPLIIEPDPSLTLPPFPNPRFCLTKDKDVMYLKSTLTKKLNQQSNQSIQAIFFFIGNNLINTSNFIIKTADQNINSFYEKYKDEDGFLYIKYRDVETF